MRVEGLACGLNEHTHPVVDGGRFSGRGEDNRAFTCVTVTDRWRPWPARCGAAAPVTRPSAPVIDHQWNRGGCAHEQFRSAVPAILCCPHFQDVIPLNGPPAPIDCAPNSTPSQTYQLLPRRCPAFCLGQVRCVQVCVHRHARHVLPAEEVGLLWSVRNARGRTNSPPAFVSSLHARPDQGTYAPSRRRRRWRGWSARACRRYAGGGSARRGPWLCC